MAELSLTSKLYRAMHDTMMEHHLAEEDVQADALAKRILACPNLPLSIRARCHMVLSTRWDRSAVAHAEEAVRVLEEQDLVLPEAIVKELRDARKRLAAAQQAVKDGTLAEQAKILADEDDEDAAAAMADADADDGANVDEDVQIQDAAVDKLRMEVETKAIVLKGLYVADCRTIRDEEPTEGSSNTLRGRITLSTTRTETGVSRVTRRLIKGIKPSRRSLRQQDGVATESKAGGTLEKAVAKSGTGYVLIDDYVDASEYVRYD